MWFLTWPVEMTYLYPIYKKVGFEDRTQKYIDMRLKL